MGVNDAAKAELKRAKAEAEDEKGFNSNSTNSSSSSSSSSSSQSSKNNKDKEIDKDKDKDRDKKCGKNKKRSREARPLTPLADKVIEVKVNPKTQVQTHEENRREMISEAEDFMMRMLMGGQVCKYPVNMGIGVMLYV